MFGIINARNKMRVPYLDQFFNPKSIAVIGASNRRNSVGMKVFRNLLAGNFSGKLYAVNPKHKHVQGKSCVASVKQIDDEIDLAVITTPAIVVPDVINECGEKNIRAALIISSGFSETGKEGKALEQSVLDNAKRFNIHLIGPNCLGVMRPHIKMNATFDNNFALPGHLALVSQSGALSAGILDWAMNRQIGFSTIASIGNSADIDFGDVLEYLALDSLTQSILLYIEGIHNARRFMSGLQTASRIKPVIVLKAGKNSQGSRAALSHTGALIGDDDVFDNALRRAGAVRVMAIEDLFSAAEICSSQKKVTGNRLAIITNGGGAGVIAADRAAELNVTLSPLSDNLKAELSKVLPPQWSHQNPIDIIGDATPERYHATLEICRKDPDIDGILTMLVPVAMSEPFKVAKQVVKDAEEEKKPILACWIGEKQVKSSWKLFAKHRVPSFDTPEKAVEAFSYLADYYLNQQLLMQIPSAFSSEPAPDILKAKAIIESALKENRTVLTIAESKIILKAFSIPVTESMQAHTADEAVEAAKSVGFPVAIKINSPDITHKTDVGGVQLNVSNAESVKVTFNNMMIHIKKSCPNATILGVTVEPMFKTPNDRELMVGVIRDIVFGPVISFGAGGTLVEVIKDRALALPPLNKFIAQQLIHRTRISKALSKFRNMPAVNLSQVENILFRVSEMVCELPYIQEMDINPLIANDKEVIAIDARIVVAPLTPAFEPYSHLAIRWD